MATYANEGHYSGLGDAPGDTLRSLESASINRTPHFRDEATKITGGRLSGPGRGRHSSEPVAPPVALPPEC